MMVPTASLSASPPSNLSVVAKLTTTTGPIAPGKTKTYKFLCTQFGTTWYHSHFSAQYGDGIVGTMVINGPATANYDVDLGPVALTDWYYKTAFELNALAMQSARGPPLPDNVLVNGKMVNAGEGGEYHKIAVTKGKKYRLRLINTSVDTHFHVSLVSENAGWCRVLY